MRSLIFKEKPTMNPPAPTFTLCTLGVPVELDAEAVEVPSAANVVAAAESVCATAQYNDEANNIIDGKEIILNMYNRCYSNGRGAATISSNNSGWKQ